ncbi:protein of unknown function [Methylocaldum szegediense]|uniref:Transposase n=1 Tax=Methylocaldum szegediense TaxID=73780 RepID=A0ABN8X9V5_9GAMM|nr:protein of unknown function [Methylocaldum szegediense]
MQLAAFEEFQHDVASADQFAVNVKLRKRRPIREYLQAFPQFGILEDVDVSILDAATLQNLHCPSGKAALRKIRRALHVKDHRVLGELLLDAFCYVHTGYLKRNKLIPQSIYQKRSVPERPILVLKLCRLLLDNPRKR